jgi:hypothetical protein
MPDKTANMLSLSDMVIIGTGALVLIVLMLVLLMALRPRRRPMSRKQYSADLYRRKIALEELAYPVLHDVRITDGQGKVMRVDHIMRLPASLLIITSGPHDAVGQVKASPAAGQWRYVAPGGAVGAMVNPVIQLHPLIQAVRSRFPLVRVRVLTVFPNSAELSGHQHRTVCRGEEVLKLIKEMATEDGTASQAVEAAWDPLSRALVQASADIASRAQAAAAR